MLTPHLDKVTRALQEGKKPTVDDLGNALAEAIDHRNFYQETLADMSTWLSKLVVAHLGNDKAAMSEIIQAFMNKHVKVMHQTNGRTH